MLTIVCGEDSVTAYNYFCNLKKQFKEKDYETYDIEPANISEITSWRGESDSLFALKKAFFIQNLNKKTNKKNSGQLKIINQLINNKDIEVISYEEAVPARFLKFGEKAVKKEFKISENIFKLLDACYPNNLKSFITLLNSVKTNADEIFIFIMLTRHIRNLLTIKIDPGSSKLAPWQTAKLKHQASFWQTDKLISFYDSFHKIDLLIKTNGSPYSPCNSLDILASYYL